MRVNRIPVPLLPTHGRGWSACDPCDRIPYDNCMFCYLLSSTSKHNCLYNYNYWKPANSVTWPTCIITLSRVYTWHRVWTSKQGINNIIFWEIVSKLYIHSSNDVKKKSFQVLMFTLASWRLGGMKLCMVIEVLISELLQQARLDSLICWYVVWHLTSVILMSWAEHHWHWWSSGVCVCACVHTLW